MKRSTELWAVLVLTVFVAVGALASVTFTPPDSTKPVELGSVTLKPAKTVPKATSTATFMRNMEKTKYKMTVEAAGLDPKKVYTLRFVKAGKKKDGSDTKTEGVGKSPYAIKVDSKGKVAMSFDLTSNPLDKWTNIEIIEHTDKDPKNMKKIASVLMGDLSKLK